MPVEIDIEHVARLARLELTDEEKERLRDQLGVILENAAKVSEVATDDVPPTAYAIPRSNVLRPDEVTPVAHGRGGPVERARGRGRPLQGPEGRGGRMTELCDRSGSELAAALRVRRVLGRRDPRLVPLAHRRRRRTRRRVPRAHRRARARAGGGGRRADRRRRRAGRGRDPARAEGRAVHARRDDHLRLEDPRDLRPALRLHAVGAASGGRRRAGRQDELRRVRDGLVERELGVRARAQPVGPPDGPRRLERRERRRRRGRRGRVGARDRYRRLGAAARVALGRGGAQADLRPDQPVRADRVRVLARHRRDAHAERPGRGGPALGDRGQGPDGRHVPGRAAARLHRGARGRDLGSPGGGRQGGVRRGRGAGRPRQRPARGRRAREPRGARWGRRRCRTRTTRSRPTT